MRRSDSPRRHESVEYDAKLVLGEATIKTIKFPAFLISCFRPPMLRTNVRSAAGKESRKKGKQEQIEIVTTLSAPQL